MLVPPHFYTSHVFLGKSGAACLARLMRRTDDLVVIQNSVRSETSCIASYRLGYESKQGDWTDYLQGITWILRAEGFPLSGFAAAIDPAAFPKQGQRPDPELIEAAFRAIRLAFNVPIDDLRLLALCARLEAHFVSDKPEVRSYLQASERIDSSEGDRPYTAALAGFPTKRSRAR